MTQRLTIISLGLLGGSVAMAVRERISGCRIVGCAHREGSLTKAKAAGLLDGWSLDPAAAVAEADLVLLCMPVRQIPLWLAAIGPHLPPGCVVSDVGSTKAAIVAAGEAAVRPPAFFVGSHPMAGSEKSGIDAARADLFDGATCIVTPTPASDTAAAARVESFWRTLGCRLVRHAPGEHDRLVALVSHLPHAAAAAIALVQESASLALHGKGFLDTTRIAVGDPTLWTDILLENGTHVVAGIDRLQDELARLSLVIQSQDPDVLGRWLAGAAEKAASVRPA
ncbi:MAG TPA: prephenate dehydrogenase/arogenate dehydrogenase family protein [Tepidisphaeraceae bacterium]|jgi:prephenate dehydrogenase